MKIVGVSNFDNDSVSDVLICRKVKEGYEKGIVDFLNNRSEDQTYFFKSVADNYQLYKREY